MQANPRQVGTAAVEPADSAFLLELFRSQRAPELAAAGLPPAEVEQLIGFQFESQRRTYAAAAGEDGHRIVLFEGAPVGRLWLAEDDDSIRLVDIVLVPGAQGRGIGTEVIGRVLADASRRSRSVRLSVSRCNEGGLRLYERLGFRIVASAQLDHEMEWTGREPGDVDP
jgi:RimJ/RimL family protein N-acetyltransferase